jgi:phosphoglucosamine mutase
MSRRWFGTEGVQGAACDRPTPELALSVGRASAFVLGDGRPARLVIGRDTRLSGGMLEAAVAAGIAAAGGHALLAGIVPTPAVARLILAGGFDGGVAISTSRLPFHDNGIILFGPDGRRLSEDVESRIEAAIDARLSSGDDVGSISDYAGAAPLYVEDLLAALQVDLNGLRVLLDCAQGATYRVAPLAFRAAGAQVEAMCVEPDGRNINAGCGVADPGFLCSRVAQGTYHLGLAFDGGGERLLAVDASGRPIDGDEIVDGDGMQAGLLLARAYM